ncbi:MAG: hypothetical protein R3Y32_04455 [Bacillota bacterium]
MLSLFQTHNNLNTSANDFADNQRTASNHACSSFAISPNDNPLNAENCKANCKANCKIDSRGKFAVIDMGSNSFRLCIFDDAKSGDESKIKFVETCRLGEGFHETLTIQPVPMARGVETCEKFVEICKENGVVRIFCFATAVVREAKNRDEFIGKIEKLRLLVHILSGNQEALCGFLGASVGVLGSGNCDCDDNDSSVKPTGEVDISEQTDILGQDDISEQTDILGQDDISEQIAIFDIGGASFEIAIGSLGDFVGLFAGATNFPTHDEIIEKSKGTYCGLSTFPLEFSHSFKMGAVRMTDMFLEDFDKLNDYILSVFTEFEKSSGKKLRLDKMKCVGIGGTITSLCGLVCGCENFKPQLHGFVCDSETIYSLAKHIQQMTPIQRLSLPFLKDKRKEIIASGSEILALGMKFFGAEQITASLTDNLEGYRLYLGI